MTSNKRFSRRVSGKAERQNNRVGWQRRQLLQQLCICHIVSELKSQLGKYCDLMSKSGELHVVKRSGSGRNGDVLCFRKLSQRALEGWLYVKISGVPGRTIKRWSGESVEAESAIN